MHGTMEYFTFVMTIAKMKKKSKLQSLKNADLWMKRAYNLFDCINHEQMLNMKQQIENTINELGKKNRYININILD